MSACSTAANHYHSKIQSEIFGVVEAQELTNTHSSSISGKTARLRGAGEKTTNTQQAETIPVKTLHTKIRQNRKQCAWEDAFQSGIKSDGGG